MSRRLDDRVESSVIARKLTRRRLVMTWRPPPYEVLEVRMRCLAARGCELAALRREEVASSCSKRRFEALLAMTELSRSRDGRSPH